MIYSADFRPDVYLITQNALADDTYMSVERDLYGDEIWIPSKEDSAEAFNIYIDEVQRGVRPANGDLKIENGRVQVTGALGVMEINGILTKMMFDHDRLRHSFYVEESYVIPWMYPYLSPHGLIMKINKDPTPYDAKTAAKDRDFWDWYVRRLLSDPMYRRDFAGQKSFSKLRAALAGLYLKQGRRAEAAQAYREAMLLYPASPEAAFRYAQEILVPLRRWDVAAELMDYTDRIDPNNRRTAAFRAYESMQQCVLNYYELLNKNLYSRVLSGVDYRTQMQQIKLCGYMTSSTEVNSVIKIIERYNLTQYDKGIVAAENVVYSVPEITIRKGSRGDAVKWLQQRLNEHGFALILDGVAGAKTIGALMVFQSQHGLKPDGICGPATKKALSS